MSRLAIAIILFTAALASGEQFHVLWDRRSGATRTRAVIESMSWQQFERESRRILGSKDLKVGTFLVYSTDADRVRAQPHGGTECNYDDWRSKLKSRGFDKVPIRCPEVKQAIKLGQAIVLRSVDAGCAVRHSVLYGHSDPLRFDIGGHSVRILDIVFNRFRDPAAITIFARSPRVSKSIARELLEYFRDRFAVKEAVVVLREDSWFFSHCEAPPVFLFEGISKVPPKDQNLLDSKEAVCVALMQWPIQCSQSWK